MHLAFFHAPWCQVCHEKEPLARQIADDAGLPLQRWNIGEDDGAEQAERRRVRDIPTLALIDGERVPFRIVGAMITAENVRHLMERSSGATS